MKEYKILIIFTIFVILLGLFNNCNGSNSYTFTDFPNATIVVSWNNILLNAIHKASPPPTVVSRSLSMVHTSIYDAWSFYNTTSIGVNLKLKKINQTANNNLYDISEIKRSISYASFRVLSDVYPKTIQLYIDKMIELGYDINDNNLNIDNACGVGNLAAKLLLEDRWLDGSNQKNTYGMVGGNYSDWTNYAPRNDPQPVKIRKIDNWQPLLVPNKNTSLAAISQSFATPHWGNVKPFSMLSGSQLRSLLVPPPCATNSNKSREALVKSALELVYYTTNMTDRIKVIAEYFGDGPGSVLPPGHWNLFAHYVSQRDSNSIEQDVKMYFILNNAVMDSGIACWDAKRHFDNARPATMIPYLLNGTKVTGWNGVCKENVEFDLKDWIPYQDPFVISPPFSDYTSGHSTFSSSSAEVLKLFTGSDKFGDSVTVKAGSSLFEANCGYPVPKTDITLYWDTFTDAADQAGISRRYGGIHYDFSDLEARKMGRQIGKQVYNKCQSLFNGVDQQ